VNWVRRLRFEDAAAGATHVDYLAAVEAALQRRSTLDLALEEAWPRSPFQTTIARLRCFRGIDTLSACGVAAEVGGFDRFERPARLTGILGIVPSERSSGGRRRRGAITKAGPGHARRLLVEAAHHYRHPPRVSYELARRQRGQDPPVVNVAWRAQQRLHRRWRHLVVERPKPVGVSVVALARELACFCWEAAPGDRNKPTALPRRPAPPGRSRTQTKTSHRRTPGDRATLMGSRPTAGGARL
jgi:transposase